MKTNYFELDITNQNLDCHIVHLSDLHKKRFGKNNKKLSDRINKLKPDMIFITGDMVSRNIKKTDDLKELIIRLSKIAPIYYSFGNHEKDMEKINPSLYKELIDFLEKYCIILDNQKSKITFKNFTLSVCGLTIPSECYKNNGGYKNLRTLTNMDVQTLIGEKSDEKNILLAHNPIFFDAYSEYGADLIFSGHVHGGCIKLPFLGGLLSPERKFFPKYFSGLYKSKNSTMIVSCGLGKFRLFNPPEIIFVRLN